LGSSVSASFTRSSAAAATGTPTDSLSPWTKAMSTPANSVRAFAVLGIAARAPRTAPSIGSPFLASSVIAYACANGSAG
jgi:hypothetical protein